MNYRNYLKERSLWAAVFIWLLFSLETFLLTIQGSFWMAVYVGFSLPAAYFAITYSDYRHQKSYMEELKKTAEQLEQRYLLPEMMGQGRRQEEKILQEVMFLMGKSMNEQVAGYKRNYREYKEYIELWIHEVKVPIAAAKMLLINHAGQETEALLEEISRIDGYTEQALYYARSNEVEKDYFIKKLLLEELVEEVILQNKKSLLGRKAAVKLHHLDMAVYSDGKWLFFILNQIIGNSIKYADREPLELEIYAEAMHNCVLLHIKDNGIGIPAGEAERVCVKGFTGSNGRKYKKSTGLGLYLCDKLCKRLGHKITIQSEEGRGCHVTLYFPKTDYLSVGQE